MRFSPLLKMTTRSIPRLEQSSSALFLCDIQERFTKAIHEFDNMAKASSKLLRGAQILEIPVFTTEQNSKALGSTVDVLKKDLPENSTILDKTRFSMVLDDGTTDKWLRDNKVQSVMIVGIESHVCVLQTTLDLLKKGFNVFIIRDAISSCNKQEVPVAIERMRSAGATITTSESALFELMLDSKHPNFKAISGLIKTEKDSTKAALEALTSRI